MDSSNAISDYRTIEERGVGTTIVLVPGLDGTALLFYRQVPLLASRFHVVTFPLPDDSKCTMDSLVELLFSLIQRTVGERGQEKVILCGESFGGALSLSFALSHPEMLQGLVIVNSFPKIRRPVSLGLGPWVLRIIPWAAMGIARRFTESHLHSPHTLPEDLAEFHERTRAIKKQGYIRRLEILRTFDIRHRLGEIETPTLFLAGDRDRLVPSVPEAFYMAERMPHATVTVLKGYGHICLINHDFNLLDYIQSWLSTF